MTIYNLGDETITTAVTGSVITEGVSSAGVATAYIDIGSATAATIQVKFNYGAGGTSVKAYTQFSIDQGSSWVDVYCATFTTSSATKIVNLSGLTAKTSAATPTDGSLSDDTAVDGIMGGLARVKITTTGTYTTNTSISVRASVR